MSRWLQFLFTSDIHSLSAEDQKKIYTEFYVMMYPMVYSYIKNHASVEDVIQDSFIKAVQKAEQLDELDSAEAWLRTLTRRNALNYLIRYKKFSNELTAETACHIRESSQAYVAASVDEQIQTKLLIEAITEYTNRMNPNYRTALDLRWNHGLSYEEIANQMNISLSAVRQMLFRARNEIKKKLSDEWHIEE